MYIYKEKVKNFLENFNKEFFAKLSSNKDFLFSLPEESDWSLIIKSHAIIESIVTDLIIARINDNKLKPIIERLPLHNNQVSKLEFIKTYELLPKSQQVFLRKLSELRNMLVHKYQNINFNFHDHILKLDKNELKTYRRIFTWYADDNDSKTRYEIEQFFMKHPIIALWFSVVMFVLLNTVNKEELSAYNKIHILAQETSDTFWKMLIEDRNEKS